MSKPNYPECEKLAKVRDKSQAIGGFLSWLREEKEYSICFFKNKKDGWEEYLPVRHSIEQLLAEYFEIDLGKAEKERQQMIEDLRKAP